MRHAVLIAATLLTAATLPALANEASLVKAGQVLFNQRCHVCHADEADKKAYGPPLTGVIGRKAGSFPGYSYSKALSGAGFVWTDEALKAWMANNTEFMPGTKMRHIGVTDEAEQDLILIYLKSLGLK